MVVDSESDDCYSIFTVKHFRVKCFSLTSLHYSATKCMFRVFINLWVCVQDNEIDQKCDYEADRWLIWLSCPRHIKELPRNNVRRQELYALNIRRHRGVSDRFTLFRLPNYFSSYFLILLFKFWIMEFFNVLLSSSLIYDTTERFLQCASIDRAEIFKVLQRWFVEIWDWWHRFWNYQLQVSG